MMNILLSKDDGVHAPGLRILYEELKKLGRVKVVAPLEEMSTTGHALTLTKPLRLLEINKDYTSAALKRTDHRGKDYFWVGGQVHGFEPESDTDCARVSQGYVAVTPLKLDVTDLAYLEEMNRLTE